MTLRKRSLWLGVALLVAAGSLPASAQVQTGNLTGTIVDPQSLPLPGVSVTITSPQLIKPQATVVTSGQGTFRFTYVPPGTYKLTAELQGFSTQAREGVAVQVGTTTDLRLAMTVGKLEEVVSVVAETRTSAIENTQLSLNLSPAQIQSLPIQRRAASVLALAPGVTPGGSALGGATRGNSFAVDGLYLNEPSSSREEVRHSLEVYQEIQVETAGHPAEYGNASGALLNVITKSGGNTFSGDLTLLYQGDKLQSTNHEGHGLNDPTEETISRNEYALTFGGPIRKDRLWFFGAFSYLPTKVRAQGFPEDIKTKTFWPIGKLTWQINDKQRASVSTTYNRLTTNFSGVSPFVALEATPDSERQSLTTVANWVYNVNSSTTIEARGAAASMPNSSDSPNKVPQVFDIVANRVTGGFGDLKNEQSRYLGTAAVTKAVTGGGGDHLFKAGFEVGRTEFTREQTFYADRAGYTHYTTLGGAPFFAVLFDPPASGPQTARYTEWSAFVQDSWKINRHLFLRPGIRVTSIQQTIPEQRNLASPLEVADWTNVEPRIGIGVDPTGSGSTAIRFHYGRYTSPMFIWYDRFNPNLPVGLYYANPAPGVFIKVFEDRYDPASNQLDPDLGRPITDEFLVSLDHQIGRRWSAHGHFVFRKFKRFITPQAPNWSNIYVPRSITNPLTGSPFTYYDTPATAPSPIAFTTNDPDAEREYKGVTVGLQGRFAEGTFVHASYTWSRAEGTTLQVGDPLRASSSAFLFWDSPNASINSTGLLDEDRTHEIKVQSVVRLPLDLTFGLNYIGTPGPAYARYVAINQRLGVLRLNAEPAGSQRYDFVNDLSLRLDKRFRFGARSLSAFVEVFNPFNWDTVTSTFNQANSTRNGLIVAIQPPRYGQVGVKLAF